MRLQLAVMLLLAATALPVAAQQGPPPPAMPAMPDSSLTASRPFVQLPDLPLAPGESLWVKFAVHTDTMIAVAHGTTIYPKGCGFSYFVGRVWWRAAPPATDSAIVALVWAFVRAKVSNVAGARGDTTTDPARTRRCLP